MSTHLAIVNIGYQALLLPRAKAIKVVELLSESIYCERDWDPGHIDMLYIAGEPVVVELRFVSPSQIRMPGGVEMPRSRQRARTKVAADRPLRIQNK